MDSKKNLLVFVVEDNLMYNKIICEYLKKENYSNVKSFGSGKDCLKSIKNGDYPDIVIQDYYLQDSTGIDVLTAVKKHRNNAEFIFLTANENVEVAVNSIKYGAYDYIIKNDEMALQKVVDKIGKIAKVIDIKHREKITRLIMVIALFVLALIIITGLILYSAGVIQTS